MHATLATEWPIVIKQRFVGFVVLVSIAVIFWPVVFVTPDDAVDFELPIFEMQPRPDFGKSEFREPVLNKADRAVLPTFLKPLSPAIQPVDVASLAPEVDLVAAFDEPHGQVSALERADFDEQGLPISWELQIATFSTLERAEEISHLLREKGHKAYVSPVTIDERSLFRVMIGPKLQKRRLIDIQAAIDDYFSVQSIIVRFTPN